MLKKIALLLLLIVPMSVFAQKFGHLKSADVLTVMPNLQRLRLTSKLCRNNMRMK